MGGDSLAAAPPRVVFDSHFKVPVIVNTRAIAENAELVMHVEAPESKQKVKAKGRPEPPPLKRACDGEGEARPKAKAKAKAVGDAA